MSIPQDIYEEWGGLELGEASKRIDFLKAQLPKCNSDKPKVEEDFVEVNNLCAAPTSRYVRRIRPREPEFRYVFAGEQPTMTKVEYDEYRSFQMGASAWYQNREENNISYGHWVAYIWYDWELLKPVNNNEQ